MPAPLNPTEAAVTRHTDRIWDMESEIAEDFPDCIERDRIHTAMTSYLSMINPSPELETAIRERLGYEFE